jgi:exonuclease SbcD
LKIVHTADWHLGHRSGRVDRTGDLRLALKQVAEICLAEQADVLLVCGDIFSELNRTETLKNWVEYLGETFGPFLRGGGTILAVTGNHDNESFAQILCQTMALAAPGVAEAGGVAGAGRFHLFVGPTFVRLADGGGVANGPSGPPACHVQFVLMPFPTPARYLRGAAAQSYKSLDERNKALNAAFAARVREIASDPAFDAALPTVLAAHLMTSGAVLRDGKTGQDAGGFVLADADLPAHFAYVALGDVHKPQSLLGLPHVRYSGSIDRLDLGEADDEKEVVVVDVGPGGLRSPPRSVPLDATPVRLVEVHDPPADMPGLADRHPDRERALVKLSVRYKAGRDDLNALLAELEAIFPRCYDRDWTEISGGTTAAAPQATGRGTPLDPKATFRQTVTGYLETQLAEDADRPDIMALVDELVHELDEADGG